MMLRHTTLWEASVTAWLPVVARLVVWADEPDMAWADVIGVAARTRAAITARLKRIWKNLLGFIRTILL